MFNPVRSRFSLAVGALLVMTALPAAAGPSVEDSLALSMSKGIRDRMFWNFSVISTKTKTKSEAPRDLNPKVVSIEDLANMSEQIRADLLARTGVDAATVTQRLGVASGNAIRAKLGEGTLSAEEYARNLTDFYKHKLYGNLDGTTVGYTASAAIPLLNEALMGDYGFESGKGYLSTPRGILAKSGDPSPTVALSVGYYFNDNHNWAVEALVLGAPVRATITGAGTNDAGEANQLVGREIINTKILPPVIKLGYYFGDRSWVVRPYVGVGAMYSIFFDTKSTDYFNQYNGGSGKTSVSIKNKLAAGPFLGLESGDLSGGWRVGFSVGRIKFSTEATLTSRQTMFRTGDPALQDYTRYVAGQYIGLTDTIVDATDATLADQDPTKLNSGPNRFNGAWAYGMGATPSPGFMTQGLTTEMMKDLAAYMKQYKGGDGSLGTFVRKQRTTLDNTLFMLSVGKSF